MDESVVPSTKLWCDHCNRLIESDSAQSGADDVRRCPHCGEVLDSSDAADHVAHDAEDEGPPKAPWHFKVLLVGTILYLIYRLIWFIMWLTHHA
jgi:phage FluMu protein Com